MKLNQFLKEMRKLKKMTQFEVAEKIQVSEKTISNWETGKTVPDLFNITALAQLYNFSLDKILLEDSTMIKETKIIEDKEKYKKFILLSFLSLLIGSISLFFTIRFLGFNNILNGFTAILTFFGLSLGLNLLLKAILLKPIKK